MREKDIRSAWFQSAGNHLLALLLEVIYFSFCFLSLGGSYPRRIICLSLEDPSQIFHVKIDYFPHRSYAGFVGRTGRMYITYSGSALSQLLIVILTDLMVHLHYCTMLLLVPAFIQSMATIWSTFPR